MHRNVRIYIQFFQLLPRGRKDIYDPNFLKSGDYEQPLQGLDDEYNKIRDSAEGPDNGYGDLTDVSVSQQSPPANEYLKPGDSLGHDYQNAVLQEDEDGDHEYHEVDEDKQKKHEDEDGDHEYHEINDDKKDDGYEHPPDLDHEYHEVADLATKSSTLDTKNTPNVEFDSLEYGVFSDSQAALLNSNQNNNNSKDSEYMHVTDDMLLPPHKRGDSLQTNHANKSSSETEM